MKEYDSKHDPLNGHYYEYTIFMIKISNINAVKLNNKAFKKISIHARPLKMSND